MPLILNRPERRNGYTAKMGTLLNRAYRQCDDDDAVRAIVLTGAGDAFCAGADFSTETSPFDATSGVFRCRVSGSLCPIPVEGMTVEFGE